MLGMDRDDNRFSGMWEMVLLWLVILAVIYLLHWRSTHKR